MAEQQPGTPDPAATEPAPETAPDKSPPDAAKNVEGKELQQKLERAMSAEAGAKRKLSTLEAEMKALREQLEGRETADEKTARELKEAQSERDTARQEAHKLRQESRVTRALGAKGITHPEPSDLIGADDDETDARVERFLTATAATDKARKSDTLDRNRREPDDGGGTGDILTLDAYEKLPQRERLAYLDKHPDFLERSKGQLAAR
jgi:hypothetical protein